ncbi:hypothetical protein BD413DRAFT_510540 [Trametes elegans]|nr:hypothetical protein BD413DRAFT_510540 [Trametes elegans]
MGEGWRWRRRPASCAVNAVCCRIIEASPKRPRPDALRTMDPGPSNTSPPDRPLPPRSHPRPPSPRRPKTADDAAALSRPRTPLQHRLPAPTPRPGPRPQFLDSHTIRASAPSSPSRSRTPGKTSRSLSPHAQILAMSAQDGGGPAGTPGEGGRALNVSDALGYLDAVKQQFQDKPDVYNHFLDIMKDFKSQVIDTPGVIERVSMLFHGNPYLIQGFNTFLPPGYRIELNNDYSDTITVTTPMGQMTQRTTMYGIPSGLAREPMIPPGMVPPYSQPPFGLPPPPVLPVGISSGSRPVTPISVHGHAPPQFAAEMQGMRAPLSHSPALQGGREDNSAVSMLNSLNARQSDKPQTGEFHHAINYLNKIKQRYQDDPETYKQFLEILQTYQKEQRHVQDQSQVYTQVHVLFKDAPDLMDEFKDFLPEAAGPSTHPAGLVGILPQPTTGPGMPGSFGQPEPSPAEKPTKPQNRRRKRADKEPAAPQKGASGRAAKRAKTNQKPETASPKFSPYQVPHSPQPVNVHVHPAVPAPMHPPGPHPIRPASVGPGMPIPSASDELLFFDRAKKALESGGTYDKFLKLLSLFSRDIIDTKTLVDRAEVFLEGDLMAQFKDLLSWDDKLGNRDEGPPGSLRTGAPDYYTARPPDDGQGPSYRRLPDSEVKLACSGRDRLCWSVLNDDWVSHPTWASEEAGFMTHKKNTFEDTLHKSEEERHEFQVHIEALTRTIAVLQPLEARIESMAPEERAAFRLKPNLGGPSRTIYERIIKRIYGYDAGNEVLRALQETPAVAVPVVLARLRRKDDEWRRAQREWNRTWREIDAKNFYKALDHQGITFKATDKKNITAKHFVLEIESAKAAQAKQRDREADAERASAPSFSATSGTLYTRSLGFQLEYAFEDVGVLHDAVKLVFSFLDHSPQQYSQVERRGIERFLRAFIPVLFMFPPQEFNSACGPLAPGHEEDSAEEASPGPADADDENGSGAKPAAPPAQPQEGVSAQDLRTRLLETAQESAQDMQGQESGSSMVTHSTSPAASESPARADAGRTGRVRAQEARTNAEDVWVRELKADGAPETGETPFVRRPFFAGTTFYTLLRLLQLLYSRLLTCKEVGARMAAEKHASLLANPIAVELGLDEPGGPSVVLQQAMEAFGPGGEHGGEDANVLYQYLLDACEKVFENELDQATFEEHMRWFFRTKAYNVFTLDRVIGAIIKQVQTVLADNKCQELWYMLQQARSAERATIHDTIRYRREAERHVGSDEKLYRLDWDGGSRKLRIQLLGAHEPTADEDESVEGRWRGYVASYVTVHPSEWVPSASNNGPVFLKRYVRFKIRAWACMGAGGREC